MQAVCLLAEADWWLSQGLLTDKPAALALFIDRYLRPGYDPLADDRHLERIARLGGSL